MSLKDYYVATFKVFVEGEVFFETVTGQRYEPNIVKGFAESRARERFPDKNIAVVLHQKDDMTLEEYKKVIGGTPGWLGGKAADEK